MADAAAAGQAGPSETASPPAAARGTTGVVLGLLRSLAVYYFISYATKSLVHPASQTGPGADDAAVSSSVPDSHVDGGSDRPPMARPLFTKGETVNMMAYITRHPVFTEYDDGRSMVAFEENIPLCGDGGVITAGERVDSGEREFRIVHRLTEVGPLAAWESWVREVDADDGVEICVAPLITSRHPSADARVSVRRA